MKTLPDHLLDEVKRALVVTDCVAIIDSEVQKKKGVTGFAIKSAYKIVKKMEGGKMIPNAVNDLLPEFAAAVEPFHADYRTSGSATPFDQWTAGKEPELADALLGVTDTRAERAKNRVLKKLYFKLRPKAHRDLQSSIPAVADVMDRHSR